MFANMMIMKMHPRLGVVALASLVSACVIDIGPGDDDVGDTTSEAGTSESTTAGEGESTLGESTAGDTTTGDGDTTTGDTTGDTTTDGDTTTGDTTTGDTTGDTTTGGGLLEGEVCTPGEMDPCGPGLECCYPCGIPDCDFVCTPEDPQTMGCPPPPP